MPDDDEDEFKRRNAELEDRLPENRAYYEKSTKPVPKEGDMDAVDMEDAE